MKRREREKEIYQIHRQWFECRNLRIELTMLRPQTEAGGSITLTEKGGRGSVLSKREHPSTLQLPYRVQPHRVKIGARKNLGSCVLWGVFSSSSEIIPPEHFVEILLYLQLPPNMLHTIIGVDNTTLDTIVISRRLETNSKNFLNFMAFNLRYIICLIF